MRSQPFITFCTSRRAPLCCVLAATSAFAAAPASAEPHRPADDAVVLATTAPGAAAPDVARLAIRDGRANADRRRYGQAQAALGAWWSMEDAPAEVRVLRAVIRQALHDFHSAEADLGAILAMDPMNGQARLTRAFVRQSIGEFGAAEDDCRQLPRSVGLTARAICLLRVEALTGSAAPALERLTQVTALDGEDAPQVRRWARAVAAEMDAMLGRSDDANRRFIEAVAEGADIPMLVAYADHLLDAGRPADVLPLLADRSEADVVLLRLAIAAKSVGDSRATHWTALLAERFAAARASGVQLHLRDEARFELEVRGDAVRGDAVSALPLARENWKNQKEPADARLVLQAAQSARDPAAAADVLGFLAATGLSQPRFGLGTASPDLLFCAG